MVKKKEKVSKRDYIALCRDIIGWLSLVMIVWTIMLLSKVPLAELLDFQSNVANLNYDVKSSDQYEYSIIVNDALICAHLSCLNSATYITNKKQDSISITAINTNPRFEVSDVTIHPLKPGLNKIVYGYDLIGKENLYVIVYQE